MIEAVFQTVLMFIFGNVLIFIFLFLWACFNVYKHRNDIPDKKFYPWTEEEWNAFYDLLGGPPGYDGDGHW